MEKTETMTTKSEKENPLINIGINVVIPSVIMTKFSSAEYLGQVYGLVVALLFPLLYGIWDLVRIKKINFFSGIGLFSILVTGGIGLLSLDRNWMIVKETAIPLIMGLAVIISEFTGHSLAKTFLGQMLNMDLLKSEFEKENQTKQLEKLFKVSSYLLGSTFFISAILNYVLAEMILVGQPGTVEFNESLGKMTALSFPVISVPMMIMVGFIMFYLFKTIKKSTNLEIEKFFNQ
jgi:intracellular septation protein A